MARIPTAETISGPASLRPSGPAPVADYSAIGRGASNLANAAGQLIQQEREKQNTIDFAAADAFATKSYLDMQNQFEQDGDYATFNERAERGSQSIASGAGALIRDPRARQQWVAAQEVTRLRQVDAIGDRGRALANQAEVVNFTNSLETYSTILSDPRTPADVRDSTRRSMEGAISVGRANGLLTPESEAAFREGFIDKAEQNLAINTADAMIRDGDYQGVLEGIPLANAGDPLRTNAATLPIVAAPGVNVADVNPAVLSRYEQVQSAFGTQLPVISGVRTGEHNDAVGGASNSRHEEENGGDAIDIDVSQLSKDERVRLIETASAMGFSGIGVYANSLHLDTGATRAWGPSYGSESVPAWAKDAIGRHTGGQITQVPVATARGVDPRFAALDYQQQMALRDRATTAQEQAGMEMRVGIQASVENAPVAIARQGEYTNDMPTANDFVHAYGAQEGMERYQSFDASVKVAQDTFAMRTMTPDEISGILERAQPTSTGDDALAQEQRFATLAKAAEETQAARAADPAGYVMDVYPAVANAWQAVEGSNDPAAMSQAIAVTALAQNQLGMEQMTLLPKAMATAAVTQFNDVSLPDDQRIGAIAQTIKGLTQNPEHQLAIYNQLIAAGASPGIHAAMEALERGGQDSQGAANRLFRAAIAPSAELDKSLPDEIKPSQIDNEIQSRIFEENSVGDVYYDLTYGSVGNMEEMTQDRAVFANSVKLRIIDGSAGGNLQTAIDMTAKDMWGDVEVVTGSASGGRAGMKILLPKGADRAPYQAGFDALMGEVGEAQAASLESATADVFGPPAAGTADAAIRQAQLAATVEQTLASGYFTGAGDGQFKFIDPNTGGPVLGQDGEPLIFTEQDVLGASAEAASLSISANGTPAAAAGAQFGASVIRPPEATP